MKVSVIGAGNMGSGFVKQLASAGHTVLVTARDSCYGGASQRCYRSRCENCRNRRFDCRGNRMVMLSVHCSRWGILRAKRSLILLTH